MQIHWHLGEEDFFAGLSEEKKAFLALATRRSYKKNEFIFMEDDVGESCSFLEEGFIKIFRISAVGKEPTFFVRKPGEFLGLAEVMERRDRKCSAQAITACTLLEIRKEDFEALLARHFQLAKKVIQVLGRRLRYLGEQIENLMVHDTNTRLIKLLIYLCYRDLEGAASWEKPVATPVSLTQEQIAAMTGSCQQTISEALKKLQDEGLIQVSRKEIVLLKPCDLFDLIA